VAEGDFTALAPVTTEDEVGALALTFNAMTAELRTLYAGLQQSEARTRGIVDSALDAVITFDAHGHITGWNPQAERLLGFSAAEARGRDVVESLVPKWDRERHRRGLARFRETGAAPFINRRFEMVGLDRDGREFPVELTVAALPSRDTTEFSAFIRDIRERKRAEEERARFEAALEKAAAEWRQTFDAIESPVLVLEEGGRIRRMNQAALAMLGAESLGQTLPTAAGEPWREGARLQENARRDWTSIAGQAFDPATRLTWYLAASPSPAGTGEAKVILVARDVTPVVRLQESLRRQETMSAMGTLVAGVAHEVRNPLFGISSTLDAFAARFGGGGESARYLIELHTQVDRLSRLMADLLEYGKPPALELAPGPLAEVVEQAAGACSGLAQRSEVEIRRRLGRVLPTVRMDRGRLTQVFQNLIDNAIRHSPAGSVVEVEAAPVAGEGIECTVRDSGPGFRPEDLNRLFEPFFTRRRGGTGLGLSIVQRIVEQHGGAVTAANHAEGGALFTVRLPLGETEARDRVEPALRA